MEPVYYPSHYFIGPSLYFSGKPVSCIKILERPLQFLNQKRDKNMKKMNKRKIKGLKPWTNGLASSGKLNMRGDLRRVAKR